MTLNDFEMRFESAIELTPDSAKAGLSASRIWDAKFFPRSRRTWQRFKSIVTNLFYCSSGSEAEVDISLACIA